MNLQLVPILESHSCQHNQLVMIPQAKLVCFFVLLKKKLKQKPQTAPHSQDIHNPSVLDPKGMSPGQPACSPDSMVAAASFQFVLYPLVVPSQVSTIFAQPITVSGLFPLPHSCSLLEDAPEPCSRCGSTW